MNLENAVFTIGGKAYTLAQKEPDGSILLADAEGNHRTFGKGKLDGFHNPVLLTENTIASYYHVEGDSGDKVLVARDPTSGQLTKITKALVTASVSAHFTHR